MKRLVSFLLTLVMIISAVPLTAFAEGSTETVALPGVEIVLEDGFDSEGTNFVAFGASGVSEDNIAVAEYALDERGTYSVTIHRAGDLSLESLIMVSAMDISAVYGKDYKLIENGYEIEVLEPGETVIQKYMKPENLADENAAQDEAAISVIAAEENTAQEAAENMNAETGQGSISPLALLKEQQTGLPSRIPEGSDVSADEVFRDAIGIDPTEIIEPSAALGLYFAPGETEKEIIFKVLEDGISEGKEVFNLSLSTLDESTLTVSPYVCSIVIEDDEPTEHSTVNFSSAKFTAEGDAAVITIEREGADYSYATVSVRTLADGSARESLEFAAIDMEVEFLPYQMEASVEIPVIQGKSAKDFSVELYDALGCKLGKTTKANVRIPAEVIPLKGPNSGLLRGGGASGGYTPGVNIQVGGATYRLASMEGSSALQIIQVNAAGDRYNRKVGVLYPPNNDWFKYSNFGDSPNSSSKWEYAPAGAADEPGPLGYLYWYSNWCGDYGGAKAELTIEKPYIYQTMYADFKTDSALNDVDMGLRAYLLDKAGTGVLGMTNYMSSKTRGRDMYGPVNVLNVYSSANNTYTYKGKYNGEKMQFSFVGERTGFSAARPEVWFWGVPCFYRQFSVNLVQPAPMKYKEVGSDGVMREVNRQPATVTMLSSADRYLYESVTFTCSPYEGDVIGGTLIGFNIKAEGSSKTVFRANATNGGDDGFVLDEALLKELDLSGALATLTDNKYYVNHIDVTPVFQYKDVQVEVIADMSDDGKSVGSFDNNIAAMTWHVGDEIPMAASATGEYDGRYSYQTYIAYACANPGDPVSAYAEKVHPDRYEDHKGLRLKMKKYYVTTEFSDQGNYIALKLEGDAADHFMISPADVLSQAEINASGNNVLKQRASEGYYILKTSDPDKYTPTPSMAYTIQLLEKEGNNGNYRPVFHNNWANATVQGFSFDLLASANPTRNIVTVTAERVDSSKYRYMILDGRVQYSSVSLRDNAQDTKDVPAQGVVVYGSSNPVSGAPAETAMLRMNAQSDENGAFEISAVRAIPGDTISVLCHHEGLWQVRYFKLPLFAKEETRNINVGKYNANTGKIEYSYQNENVMLVNLMSQPRSGGDRGADSTSGIINLPIRTNYTPYIRNFYFSHSNNPYGNTMGNTAEIVEEDSITFSIEVENNDVTVSAVKLLFMKDGQEMASVDAEQPYAGSRIYKGTVSSSKLVPGMKLEFQIVSPEKETATFDTEGAPKGAEVPKVFPRLDSGLTFFVPDRAGPSQELQVALPDDFGKVPMLGGVTSKVSSGKLIYEEEYSNQHNKEEGFKYRTVGFSIDVGVDKESRKKLVDGLKQKVNQIKSTGGDSPTKAAVQSYPDVAAAALDNDRNAAYARIDADGTLNAAQKQDAKDAWDADPKHSAEEYNKTAYMNGVASMAEEGVRVGLTLILRFEYLYDPAEESWEWTGTELYINIFVSAGKTKPFMFLGLPWYMYIGGKISLTFEFAFNYDSAEGEDGILMRKRVKDLAKKSGDISPVMSSGSPWITVAGTLNFWLGLGFNKVASVRGIASLQLAVKFNPDTRWSPNLGYLWGVEGGFGFDLFVISSNINLGGYKGKHGAIYETRPVFSPGTDKGNLQSGNGNLKSNVVSPAYQASNTDAEAELTFRPYDMGSESYSKFGEQPLKSTLVPVGEEELIEGTLEYIRPVALDLGNDNIMLFFLRNMEGGYRNNANASSLCYVTGYKAAGYDGKETVIWGDTTELETDASFDTMPSAVIIGDDVYVAWSSVHTSGSSELEDVKTDLSNMEIHLARIRKNASGEYVKDVSLNADNDGIISVTNDSFMDTGVSLVNEDGKLALYYFKEYVNDAATAEELTDYKANYNTWARKIFDPQTGEFILQKAEQKTTSGAIKIIEVEEYLIPIQHSDYEREPFVSYYQAGTYTTNGKVYRIVVYTVEKNDNSGNVELWAKVDNLTDERSYYQLQVSEGSESLSQPHLTQIKRRAKAGAGGSPVQNGTVVDDLMLTWITDGTKVHTISAYDVFTALMTEDGSLIGTVDDEYPALNGPQNSETSYELIQQLSDAEISMSDWSVRAAGSSMLTLSSKDFAMRYPVLSVMANTSTLLDDLGIVRDFGTTSTRTTLDAGGNDVSESYSGGVTLESYHIVAGADNNVYMFWTWPAAYTGAADDTVITGNEIWGSAYETDIDEKDAENRARGWSEPVQVTDYTTRSDAADYPNGRVIDEITPLIGTDSGALIIANTYAMNYDPQIGIVYGKHSLSEIRCESEGSLKVSDLYFESPVTEERDDYPSPGEEETLVVTVMNDGLLAARDYAVTVTQNTDGGKSSVVKTVTGSGSDASSKAIYAGDSVTFYIDCTVPSFSSTYTVEATAQEYRAGTVTPYGTNDSKSLSVNREAAFEFDFLGDTDTSYMNASEINDLISIWGSTMNDVIAKITASMDDPEAIHRIADTFDTRAYFLYETYENVDGLVKSMFTTSDLTGTIPFVAFIPVTNVGNKKSDSIDIDIIREKYAYNDEGGKSVVESKIVGSTQYKDLDAGGFKMIPVPVQLEREMIGDLGQCMLKVQVSHNGKRVDPDSILVNYRTLENLLMTLDSADSAHPVSVNASGEKHLSMKPGESVQLKTEVYPFNKTADVVYVSDMLQPDILSVDDQGSVTAFKEGKCTVYAYDNSSYYDCIDYVIIDVSSAGSSDSGSGSSGSGSGSGGGSSSGGGAASQTPAVTPSGQTGTSVPGSVDVTTTAKTNSDGTVTTTASSKDGTIVETKTDRNGNVTEVTATVSVKAAEDAQKAGTAVTLPASVPKNTEVSVSAPAGRTIDVAIPVADSDSGTVLYKVNEDGSREILKDCIAEDGKLTARLEESCTLVAADNEKSFSDVEPMRWSFDDIRNVTAREIFNGNGDGTFGLHDTVLKGMITQVFYNIEKNAKPGSASRFTDRSRLLWFENSVGWAAEENILTGNPDGTSGGMEAASREVTITMFHRYAKKKGMDVSARGDLSVFRDYGSVRDYSREAMEWAVGAGLINGDGGRLNPDGTADKEQLAAMTTRFLRLMHKQMK